MIVHVSTPLVVEQADAYAAAAHGEIDHKRKYTGEPCIVHPQAVAAGVATVPGMTPEDIAIALLHDVVEDTRRTLDEIRQAFGPVIAAGVDWLTDPVNSDGVSRVQRKVLIREKLASAPSRIQTIKYHDIKHNTPFIVAHDIGFARVYLPEVEALLAVMTKGDADTYRETLAIVAEGRRVLERVLAKERAAMVSEERLLAVLRKLREGRMAKVRFGSEVDEVATAAGLGEAFLASLEKISN